VTQARTGRRLPRRRHCPNDREGLLRVLLDECVDRRLAVDIQGHDVKTVPEAGWAALKKGELLTRTEHEFEAFVTVHRYLPFNRTCRVSPSRSSCFVLDPTASRICAPSFLICSRSCLSRSLARSHGLASNNALERTRFARRSARTFAALRINLLGGVSTAAARGPLRIVPLSGAESIEPIGIRSTGGMLGRQPQTAVPAGLDACLARWGDGVV